MRGEVRGWEQVTTPLHEERLDAVMDRLLTAETGTVVDLGCGSGALLERLVRIPRLRRIVGLDSSARALAAARARLADRGPMDPRVVLKHRPVTASHADLGAVEAAALVETLEHIDPGRLSGLERAVFRDLAPSRAVLTTPNRDYNAVYGLEPGELRHPHHRFEWDRRKFEAWAAGVGRRTGYEVSFEAIGPAHAWLGSPTQMAVLRRRS